MGTGNYKFKEGFQTDNTQEAYNTLASNILRISGQMVLIPQTRMVGREGIEAIQPVLLHGPISLSRTGFKCFRNNFPNFTSRDTRTDVVDSFQNIATILTSSTADPDYEESFKKPLYENTEVLEKWASQFENWMNALRHDPADLDRLAQPLVYMTLLTDYGFDRNRFELAQAYSNFRDFFKHRSIADKE